MAVRTGGGGLDHRDIALLRDERVDAGELNWLKPIEQQQGAPILGADRMAGGVRASAFQRLSHIPGAHALAETADCARAQVGGEFAKVNHDNSPLLLRLPSQADRRIVVYLLTDPSDRDHEAVTARALFPPRLVIHIQRLESPPCRAARCRIVRWINPGQSGEVKIHEIAKLKYLI